MSDALRFVDLDTPALSDAMDRLGIQGQCHGIRPLVRGSRVVGPAWTVRYGPIGVGGGTVGDYIDDVPEGAVVVLDNGGRQDATVWGDLLTMVASARGLAGTAIDGVCRDSDRAVELEYPIYCRGTWMRTGKDRVRVEAYAEPVTLGGVRVEPGDILVGDSDGIVVVPAVRAEEVAAVATEVVAAEARIRQAIAEGRSLAAARREARYHSLQSRSLS